MNWDFSDMHTLFSGNGNSSSLIKGTWGIEREALRIDRSGELALTDHPAAFGDKLTNPRITTDFSESQIEMITPPRGSIDETYRELELVHDEVKAELNGEYLWPLSMPGILPEDHNIPIARYDGDRSAKENEVYRKGLALRYGKKMQMISGIHYNYSFSPDLLDLLYTNFGGEQNYSDFVNSLYFALARNYLRYRWLLLYLFGASPVIDQTYEQEMLARMKTECICNTAIQDYSHYATSLRMSKFGYFNSLQNNFAVSHNSLEEYAKGLKKILFTKHEEYTRIGLCKNGEKVQLNDHILQKDSEFYSSIRFKQITGKKETLLDALMKRGVAYIEMRLLDLDPFNPQGISRTTMNFVHTFMLYCLFTSSPRAGREELQEMNKNHHLVALTGRKKDLKLFQNNRQKGLQEWGREILEDMSTIAGLLDTHNGGSSFTKSVEEQKNKLEGKIKLPSEQIVEEMAKDNHSITSFGTVKAKEHGTNLKKTSYA